MARSPFAPAVALLLLGGIGLAPSSAGALDFTPYWQLAGWNFVANIGNTDFDAQDELLFESKVDGHLALVDGLTGVIAKEFTEFKATETSYIVQNIDADAVPEIILSRLEPTSGPYSPLTRAFKRSPGGYTPVWSHSDSLRSISLIHLRSAGQTEFFEMSANDIRVRDLNGAPLFTASSAVSGWTGVDPSIVLADLDGDGVSDLGVTQNAASSNAQTLFFHYNGGFVYTWSASSWFMEGATNTDGDAHAEIQAFNWIDGRYAYFDGVSGTPDLELPEFTFYNNSTVFAVDVNGDGRQEIFASRPAGPGVTPLVRAYQWVAGNYVQMFTHTEEPLSALLIRSRDQGHTEFLDVLPGDIILRDAQTGAVVFRASTQIPGWSGANMGMSPVDLDNNGIFELLIQDNSTARVIRFSAGAYTQLWSSTAWRDLFPAPKVDDNTRNGLFAAASSDGHYGLLDPLTGAVRQEFPAFLASESAVTFHDFDHDGRSEILLLRVGFQVSPLTTCYRWNGSSFATMFSHQDAGNNFLPGPFRSTTFDDLLELDPPNSGAQQIRVRGFDGSVVFRTSTDIPGWSGLGVPPSLDTMDVNHDGLVEFLATDDSAVRLMHYIGPPVGVEDPHDGPALRLAGGSPNPFHASTTLSFSTRNAGDVRIAIYDASGRVVRRLDQHLPTGNHDVRWDGRDQAGRAVPNGVLFYEVRAGGVRQSRKLVRIGR